MAGSALGLNACHTGSPRRGAFPSQGPKETGAALPTLSPPPRGSTNSLLLATGFDVSLCHCVDTYEPEAGCDFCYQGICEVGSFGARTGKRCVRVDRYGVIGQHEGVVKDFGSGWPFKKIWSGLAHRIPELTWSGDPRPPAWIELHQCTPAPYTWPAEVVILPDRRIGLQVFHFGTDPIVGTFRAPVDRWFATVLHAVSGQPAKQELFIYDDHDELVEVLSGEWVTNTDPVHSDVRQKCGGDVKLGTKPGQNVTYHDDWWIAAENLGPYRVTREIPGRIPG
jgi:hypothetical protein